MAKRAGGRCEYCQLHEDDDAFTFHLEHIIAKQHGGDHDPDNLAWSCQQCNARKGPNLTGRLKATGDIIPLFHPRRQNWNRHFRWNGPYLEGKTKTWTSTPTTVSISAISSSPPTGFRLSLEPPKAIINLALIPTT